MTLAFPSAWYMHRRFARARTPGSKAYATHPRQAQVRVPRHGRIERQVGQWPAGLYQSVSPQAQAQHIRERHDEPPGSYFAQRNRQSKTNLHKMMKAYKP